MPQRKARDAIPNLLLQQARLERGWTQSDVSRNSKLLISDAELVSRWERGLSRPREKQLPLIARVLNLDDPAELFAAAGYGSTPIGPKNVAVLTLEVDGDFIRAVHNVANPDKLAHLNLPSTLGKEWRIRS